MPTHDDYINISRAVYSNGGPPTPPAGWTLVSLSSQVKWQKSDDGFQAFAVQNTTTHEVVVAFQGTNLSASADMVLGGLADDISITLGINPACNPDAAAFVTAVKQTVGTGVPIFVTGHSLGGEEAEYVAATVSGISGFMTIGAPGVPNLSSIQTQNVSGTNYCNRKDTICNTKPPNGGYYGVQTMVGDFGSGLSGVIEQIAASLAQAGNGLLAAPFALLEGAAIFASHLIDGNDGYAATVAAHDGKSPPNTSVGNSTAGAADALVYSSQIKGDNLSNGGSGAPTYQNGVLSLNGESLTSLGNGAFSLTAATGSIGQGKTAQIYTANSQTLSLSGTSIALVDANGDKLSIGGNSSVATTGSSNTINLTGTGSTLNLFNTLNLWDSVTEAAGVSGVVNLNGAQTNVTGGGYRINVTGGAGNAVRRYGIGHHRISSNNSSHLPLTS